MKHSSGVQLELKRRLKTRDMVAAVVMPGESGEGRYLTDDEVVEEVARRFGITLTQHAANTRRNEVFRLGKYTKYSRKREGRNVWETKLCRSLGQESAA